MCPSPVQVSVNCFNRHYTQIIIILILIIINSVSSATGVARSIMSGQQLRANSSTLDHAGSGSGFVTTKPGPRKMQSTPAMSQSQATVLPQQTGNIATINASSKKSTNPPIGRGVPPPIPPNKPVIPPKREGSSSRLVSGSSSNGSKETTIASQSSIDHSHVLVAASDGGQQQAPTGVE